MMYIGPVMTLVFSFQLPAGVILYWMTGYVFGIFQQLYINRLEKEGNGRPRPGLTAGKLLMEDLRKSDGKTESGAAPGKQLPPGKGKSAKNKIKREKGGKKRRQRRNDLMEVLQK